MTRLFLCGDVMTGRGIDQVLSNPGDPRLYESYMTSAVGYVTLAERANGAIEAPVGFPYIWGDSLGVLARWRPDLRIINLETSVTSSDDPWPNKGINYRMHPANIPCLTAAGIDCCTLANNHVLDWGYSGLAETIDTLTQAGIATAGVGDNWKAASKPAILPLPDGGRVLVFSVGTGGSGIPGSWAASRTSAGVYRLDELSADCAAELATVGEPWRQPGDIVVVSIHWGGNWGYKIADDQIEFAHHLIDASAVDIIHGHSSHHPQGIELYKGKPVLYGCGDFINDYEGIRGHERFRGDLTLMYFVDVSDDGHVSALHMMPLQIRNFRLNRPSGEDAQWLKSVLQREGRRFNAQIDEIEDQVFSLSLAK